MGDMLIRGIEQNLKRQLEENARRNHRSLSEEAIALIKLGINFERSEELKAGDQLRLLVGEASFTPEELDAIAASRSEPDHAPPDFS